MDEIRKAFEKKCRIDPERLEYDQVRNTYDYIESRVVLEADEIYRQYVVMQWIGFETGYKVRDIEIGVWERRWEADQKRMMEANLQIDRLRTEIETLKAKIQFLQDQIKERV